MGSSLFGGGAPKIDTSKQDKLIKEQRMQIAEQERLQKEQEEELRRKSNSSARAKRGQAGANTLLTGLDTGITPVDQSKRQQLG